MESPRNAVIYKCRHRVMCFECAKDIKDKFKRCHVCRYYISDVIIQYDWYFLFIKTKFTLIFMELSNYKLNIFFQKLIKNYKIYIIVYGYIYHFIV